MADYGSLPVWMDHPLPPFCQVSAVITFVEGTDCQDMTSTWPLLPPASSGAALVAHSYPLTQILCDQVMHLAPVHMRP